MWLRVSKALRGMGSYEGSGVWLIGGKSRFGVQGKSAVNSTRSVSCYWLSGDWIR